MQTIACEALRPRERSGTTWAREQDPAFFVCYDHPHGNGFLERKSNRIKAIERSAFGQRDSRSFGRRMMLNNRQEARPVAA